MAIVVDSPKECSLEGTKIESFETSRCDISRIKEINSQCLMANANEEEVTSASSSKPLNDNEVFFPKFIFFE